MAGIVVFPPSTTGSVWTNATRTLTSDPATDAGAATFVWTHATRTLTADPATDAGAATLVWTHATRQLTSLGTGVSTLARATNQILGAGATVDLRPGSGKSRKIIALITTSGGSSGEIDMIDGSNTATLVSTPGGTTVSTSLPHSDSTLGMQLNNTGGQQLHYSYSYMDWIQ